MDRYNVKLEVRLQFMKHRQTIDGDETARMTGIYIKEVARLMTSDIRFVRPMPASCK